MEYILKKTVEIKAATAEFEREQVRNDDLDPPKSYKLSANQRRIAEDAASKSRASQDESAQRFIDNVDGVGSIVKRSITEEEARGTHLEARKRVLDETDNSVKRARLKEVSPWIPMFTPEAEVHVKAPPKRPTSPMSGRPIRSKDLIPINLTLEVASGAPDSSSGATRYICPVSR